MKAEIITIGDEILIGQIVDTNSAWISGRLNEAGITVGSKISIADDRGQITATIDEALRNNDLVIVTGGLGPTKDDITKKTLADYFGSRLVRHEPTYEFIRALMTKRGIGFNELNRAQAMVPECCTVLMNRNGTAPGMWFEREGRILVSLPGVPFEMMPLIDDEVLPRIREHFALKSVVHKTAITFGLAESALALKIAPWEDSLPPFLKLAYLPNPSQIRLRLSAYDVDRDMAREEIDRQFARLEKLIPAYVIGYGDATVASATAGLLVRRGVTLAVAESCTGGALSGAFTAMPGASSYFAGSVVAYSNSVKERVLGVDPADLERYGAVSRQVAEQMAAGVRRITGADYAVSTTGIAGPTGGSEEKPVGTVWIGIATPQGVSARKMVFGHLRQQNIERATANAINLLRLTLTGDENTPVQQGLL